MTYESPAKVKVKAIEQVAIVVNDLQKVAENYWNILGIGPWDIYAWEAPLVYDRKYHGKPAWAKEKIAVAQVGGVELELCQSIVGNSIYQDFLIEHGEGLHHLFFLVDDADRTAEILAKEGFPSLQSAHFGPPEHSATYYNIDIKPLHAIWEPIHKEVIGDVTGAQRIRYPSAAHESPAKVKVKSILRVGIVVKDVQQTAENYWNILGIGPWDVYSWEAPLVYDRKYHGKPAWAREKIAVTQVGKIELELCQYIDGDSIYRDYLTEHGEGLHHLSFLVDDADETAEILASQGFPSLQSGRFGPPEHKGAYHYIDMKPLGTVWEPIHYGESVGVEPARYP
jgi:catechol 2,3-dioxygenase-like lactoylglutathione lyase family enzyme